MDIQEALSAVKHDSEKVARVGWSNSDRWVYMVRNDSITVGRMPVVNDRGVIDVYTPTNEDIMAKDWITWNGVGA